MINSFYVRDDETHRISEGLSCRGLTDHDVVAIVWNSEKRLYVVFFREATSFVATNKKETGS